MLNKAKPSLFDVPLFSNLFGFASISAGVLSFIAIFCMHRREWNLRKEPFYKDAMLKCNDHKTAKYLIGEPIRFKRVPIFDRRNIIASTKATFFIPFKGKYYDGKMNVVASILGDNWTIHELTLELDKDLADKKLIIFKNKQLEAKKNDKEILVENEAKAKKDDVKDEDKKGENGKEILVKNEAKKDEDKKGKKDMDKKEKDKKE